MRSKDRRFDDSTMKCIKCIHNSVSPLRNGFEKRIFFLITALSSIVCTVFSDISAYRTTITCEGKQLLIKCEEGTRINLIRANFGRFSILICNDHGNLEWSVDCMAPGSSKVMQESCQMKQNCTIPASSAYFGDPCPGTQKYLEVQYQCLPDMPKRRSQGSTGAFKQQTPPPIVIPRRGEHRNGIDVPTNHANDNKRNESSVEVNTSEKTRLFYPKHVYVVTEDETTKSSTAATTASTTTTVKSSTTSLPSDNKNVENGIFVRHPHPGFQEHDVSNGDDQRRKIESVNSISGSVSSTEQLTNIKAVSETTEVIPTNSPPTSVFSIDIATHCAPTQSRNLSWNWTPIQHIATQPCPSGSKGIAKWFCSFDSSQPQWVPPEADLSDCTSHWVRMLEETINKNDMSVTSLATKLSRITKIKTLYGGDIHKVTDIVNQLVTRMEALLEEFSDYRSRNQFVKDVLDSIHESCNNLLENLQRYSWLDLPPKQRNEAATHLMWALERTSILFSETNTANSDYNRMLSNIYVGVHTRVSKETYEGIELPLVTTNNGNEVNSSEKGVVTAINMNSYLSSNRVYLPLQTLKQSEKESITRITLVVYTKLDALFVPTADSVESSVANEENVTTIVNSNVIGLTLNKESFPMNAKVRLTFRHTITVNVTNPKCVFWDVAKLKWSSNGCELLRWNLTHTTCECDHLTNFAVLMQIKGIPKAFSHETAFRVITSFGCSIAAFCLIFTLVIFMFSKNVKGDRITIRTNLCLCLLIAELLFLFGISQTETIMLCRFIALVLHYIILSSFLWMFFEGFQLYVMLIEVFESERSRLRYYYLFAYGIPLLIVSVCAYYDPYSYGTAKHCWLTTDNYFIHSFAVAILLSNLVFLTIALCVMCKHISSLSSVVKPNKDENKIKSIRVWLRGALALVFLLGMTWMSALLYLNQETRVMAYLFTIFNTFQGLFIFIFHCFQIEKVRERYSRLMNSLQSKSNYLSSSSIENSSSMNSAEKRKSVNQSDTTSISNQNSSQTQEPIIAPNSGSALTPTLRRVSTPSGAKYFITGKVDGAIPENEYGFRRVEEMRSRQKQRCRGHYCDHALRNTFVEHVYECIDDNPYTAKFAPSACSCRQDFNFRSQPESCIERDDRLHLEESANAFQEIKLPAIICDNSTVISKANCKAVASPKHRQKYREDEKRNIVAKLNGRQVIIQTENHSLTGRFDVNI